MSAISRSSAASSYRTPRPFFILGLLALLTVLTLLSPAAAQRRPAAFTGPRAIALLEIHRPAPDSGQLRKARTAPRTTVNLRPIAIFIDGRLFDASLYRATPVPMSIESGNVYEAQKSGEPAGYFTINAAQRTQTGWLGVGDWAPARSSDQVATNGNQSAPRQSPARDSIYQQAQRATPDRVYDESQMDRSTNDDQPPVMRRRAPRSDSSGSSSDSPPQSSQSSSQSSYPDSRSSQSSSGSSYPDSRSPQSSRRSDDDPDRPIMRRSPSSDSNSSDSDSSNPSARSDSNSNSDSNSTSQPGSDSDPNRPVLRRRGEGSNSNSTPENPNSASSAPASSSRRATSNPSGDPDLGPLATPTPPEVLVAVSDARNLNAHRYDFVPKPDERQRLTSAMRALAIAEIDRGLHTPARPAPKPSARSTRGTLRTTRPGAAAPPPSSTTRELTDVDLRFFDVDYDNSAELVLTARSPAATAYGARTPEAFVTVVARVDLGGEPRKLFSLVTTADRLDAYPRLQLVDAVDADGDGRAEFLFRQFSSSSASFSIYRVGRDQLTRIFQGGSAD